jgi:hypothetical protein
VRARISHWQTCRGLPVARVFNPKQKHKAKEREYTPDDKHDIKSKPLGDPTGKQA